MFIFFRKSTDKFSKRIFNQTGQSILEIVIALALFSVFVAGSVVYILGSLNLVNRSSEHEQALMYAQAGLEAVRDIKSRAWNTMIYNQSALTDNSDTWQLAGANTSESLGRFARTIKFLPVYRDAQNQPAAADTVGAYQDILSKDVISTVSWNLDSGATTNVELKERLTAWDAKSWQDDNWSHGAGQAIWRADNNQYWADDGNLAVNSEGISLKADASSTYPTSGYFISSAFKSSSNAAFIAISWQTEQPACQNCSINFQIQTAADNNGNPGGWSDWSGSQNNGEANDYFTVNTGELINAQHNNSDWIRYKAIFAGDGQASPILKKVLIYYQ